MTVRRLVVAAAAVALVAATVGAVSAGGAAGDQSAKPVAERTGGWVCYEPAP